MSFRDPSRPRFTEEDALRIAAGKYGITGSVQELPGERDRNYLLTAESCEEYTLKIAAVSERREVLEFQNSAMQHISEYGDRVQCPTVVETSDGEQITSVEDDEGNSHFVRMLTYLSGKVLAKVKPHPAELLRRLGESVGYLTKALQSFSHPAASREFYWDLRNAGTVINEYKGHIDDSEKLALVEHFHQYFTENVAPLLTDLRTTVVHNDANDYNVIVTKAFPFDQAVFGILDFGDMVHTCTVSEVVIAATYAILDKDDPISAAAEVVGGYNSVSPLTELEIGLLFPMICARLATSVSIAAYQRKLEPNNEYLKISQEQILVLMRQLREVHPRFATFSFRHACGLEPCPQSIEVQDWLERNQKQIGSIVEFGLHESPAVVLDLSVGSLDVENLDQLSDIEKFIELVVNKVKDAQAVYGVGRYNEARLIYAGGQYVSAGEMRTVHIAVDLFLNPGTRILAPMDGRVHSFLYNKNPLDNGPTIVLEHELGNTGLILHTLYAHLSEASLDGLEKGKEFKKGQEIARVGEYPTNGGWPPHLHFQLIVDMLGWEGDFFGAAAPSQRDIWLSICPNPNVILGIPENVFPKDKMAKDEILKTRESTIGRTLSVSYKKPLNIVRGHMQFLYDETGRRYLDVRNNVPHVGHSHPRVVEALSKQAAVLNTNTRYLHENLVRYAERLREKLPEPLSVCFFVNSGSEANELALRLAKTHTGRQDIVVIEGAYHGNTGSLVDISPYKFDGPGGEGAPSHVHKVAAPDVYRGPHRADDSKAGSKYAKDVQEVTKRLKKEGTGLAAFVCEPLMGCAGQIVFPDNYLREAFAHVRRAGGVCIVDEVQVGFGRVGTHFWGFETQGVVPDIVTMGKPIGNGHPMGAVVTTPEIARSFETGMEWFTTTGGNPVSCAVGLAVLDVIEEEGLQQRALDVGRYLVERLTKLKENHTIIGDVRGTGLFIGVELVRDRKTLEPAAEESSYVANRMRELGVLLSTDGLFHNVLLIKPPLVFTKEDCDQLADTLDRVLSEDFIVR
ncbi:MAG: aminotransferase class III-fold pyridoxal phosphate-dependent enzyme [Candidatus Thorarchaeota archaeon]|nr:MAG: aminotransferase class III-fold pyridoxal phosphate-dependent enzyme [Candidatus Thorarchaeota archaeon]